MGEKPQTTTTSEGSTSVVLLSWEPPSPRDGMAASPMVIRSRVLARAVSASLRRTLAAPPSPLLAASSRRASSLHRLTLLLLLLPRSLLRSLPSPLTLLRLWGGQVTLGVRGLVVRDAAPQRRRVGQAPVGHLARVPELGHRPSRCGSFPPFFFCCFVLVLLESSCASSMSYTLGCAKLNAMARL